MEKLLTVDWNSLDSLQRTINILKSRRGELNSNKLGSRRERNKKIFDSCLSIWDTDISSVFVNCQLDNTNNDFYVYVHCDPDSKIAINYEGRTSFLATLGVTHRPVYVGKGRGDRCHNLDRNGTHRKFRQKLKDFGRELLVFKVKEELSELDALCYESKLIDIFGLHGKGGCLFNLDEGVNSTERRILYKEELLAISSIERAKQIRG